MTALALLDTERCKPARAPDVAPSALDARPYFIK